MAVLRGGFDLELTVDDVITLIMGPPEGADVNLERLEALYWSRREDTCSVRQEIPRGLTGSSSNETLAPEAEAAAP